jgi:DNA polymerase-4
MRSILHVDMDAFFASVEQLDDPALRGQPVLVGHDGPRGVVAAASYEARVFGCASAQPMAVAKRRCPHARIVPPRGERYRELSDRVFALFAELTPLVEPLSIDEAFLDVTGSERLFGPAATIAADIRRRIFESTGLTASVGVAPNKFLAKLASEWDKPDGLTVVLPGDITGRVAALPIRRLWGVGPVQEARLLRLGIATFGDLQALTPEEAAARLGPEGPHLRQLALGQDDRPVVPDAQARSLGAEHTFERDVRMPEAVRDVLRAQAERVAIRLRRQGLCGRTVTLKIRYGAFVTVTRRTTLPEATDRTDLLCDTACALWARWAGREFRPVRLIGVSVSQLQGAGESGPGLFPDPQDLRRRALDRATDAVRERFGSAAIRRGAPLSEPPPDHRHPERRRPDRQQARPSRGSGDARPPGDAPASEDAR